MIDLQVQGVAMKFGGNQVLSGVAFTIDRAQICGLIGPNGAGKSTLINVLTGVYEPSAGRIVLNGARIDGLAPHEIALKGIGRTFQISRAFMRMSVIDNLLVPQLAKDRTLDRHEATNKANEALEFLGLSHLSNEYARSLSGGQRKLLELARLMMLDPELLILDEPFAGVHPKLKDHIQEFITRLRAEGKAFVIVEHDMETIFRLSERILVLSEGHLLIDAHPDEVRHDERVIQAYLGRDVTDHD